jgi:carboxymethylenebutenolidase
VIPARAKRFRLARSDSASHTVIATDRAVLKALLDITAYAPHNIAHAIPTLIAREAAHERQIAASWHFHDSIMGAKAEVIAQSLMQRPAPAPRTRYNRATPPLSKKGVAPIMDARVRELVDAYSAGQLSRRVFLSRTAQIAGAGTAAYLLVACAGGQPDNLEVSPAREAPAPPTIAMPAMPVETRAVTYQVDGIEAPGFLAVPTVDRTLPGVVLIQEWWGLDAHIKDVAQRLAERGFVVLAPDLYRGEVASEPSDARRLAMALVREQALADIQGAADYLAAQPFVAPKRVGVMGFCMGGALAMQMAYTGRDIGASVVFYGGGIQPGDADLAAVTAPILGLYGADDAGIPVAMVEAWGRKLTELGKVNTMVVYPGAGHAFFNDTRPAYNAEAATDAWERTLGWLRTHLV